MNKPMIEDPTTAEGTIRAMKTWMEVDANAAKEEAEVRRSSTACSAVEESRAYGRGYAAGKKSALNALRDEHTLHLREGGVVIIRECVEIDEGELHRIQGWVATQLIIRQQNAERIHGGAGQSKPRDASTPLDAASC